MNGNGPLDFQAYLDSGQFNREMAAMERRILGFSGTATRQMAKVDDTFNQTFKRLGQLAVGAFAFKSLSDLPQQILKVRSEFQGLEIAFGSILKSGTKAQALLSDLTKFAGETPFSLLDVASGAKQLLAYGYSVNDITKNLRVMGDVASGVNIPIGDLIYLMGTLKTQGRAYAVDIRQLAGRGIPIYQALADVLKINVDEVNKFVEAGKVGFKEVDQALKNMTSNGGIFAGLMDAQSKSLKGLQERLGDAWDLMLNDIGKKNEGLAAEVFTVATEAVQHYQDVVNILGVLAGTYGAYRAAVVLTSVAQSGNIAITAAQAIAQATAASASHTLTISQTRAAAATALLSRAQAVLPGTMLVNPVVILATAIAALTTGYLLYKEEVIEVKTAQELLAESAKEVSGDYNKQRAEVTSLIGIIKNQNVAESERIKAYDKLKSIAPDVVAGLDFQRAKTEDLTKSVNEYLVSLQKKIRFESAQGNLKEALDTDTALEKQIGNATELLKQKKKLADLDKKNPNGRGPKPFSIAGAPTDRSPEDDAKAAEAVLNGLAIRKKQSQQTIDGINAYISNIYTPKTKEALNAEILGLEQTANVYTDKLGPAYKLVEEKIIKLKAERDKLGKQTATGPSFSEQLAKSESIGALRALKTIADTDNKLQDLQKKVKEKADDAVNGSKDKAQLEQLNRDIDSALGKKTKAQKDAEREAKKSGPLGSLDYYEQVIKKIDESLGKLVPGKDDAKIAQQLTNRAAAEAKAEELRKRYAVKSFEDELSEKEKLYTLYTKWQESYGKESADVQFKELKKAGDSWVDYLNKQIENLKDQRDNAGLSDKEAVQLVTFQTKYDEATSKKTPLQTFNEGLQKAQFESKSLGDYLTTLKAKQDELDKAGTNAPDYYQKKQVLAEQLVNTQRQLIDLSTQFLNNSASSGQQELAIKAKYNDLKLGLDQKYNGQRTAEYETARKDIENKENEELDQFQQRKLEESQAYKNLTKVILEEGQKALKIQIDRQRAVVAEAEKNYGKASEVYKRELKKLQELEKEGEVGKENLFKVYTAAVGQFGQALSQLGGEAGATGQVLVMLAGTVATVAEAMKKDLKTSEKLAIGIQGVIGLIDALGSASQQRKQADENYYNRVLTQQQQYNVLLNEQLGLTTKSKNNLFGQDYLGEVNDNYAKLTDAQTKYQASLKKLEEGRAKAGLREQVNSSKALNIIGSAALTGAGIGSFLGPLGALAGGLIGGAVGAISNLFGGANEKVDQFVGLLQEYPELIQKGNNGVLELNSALAESLVASDSVDDATKKLIQSSLEWQKQIEEAKEAIKEIVKTLVGDLGGKLGDSLVNAFKMGTDAAVAFKGTLEDILESFTTQLIYSKILSPYLEKFGDEVKQSLAPGGDGRIDDDTARLYKEAPEIIKSVNSLLQQAQDGAKSFGFDILKNKTTSTGTNQDNVLRGNYTGLSENTGSALLGQYNAQRILTAQANDMIRQQLLSLNRIDNNTAQIADTNAALRQTNEKLDKLYTEISYNGVKIR